MNMAMSNSTGVARFSRECPSEEQCGLNVAAQRNSDLIDTSTVDAFLHKYDIASVDILKVGPGVQQGSESAGGQHASWRQH